MVKIYTGTPGSGKSLHCAKDIFFKLNRKQRVISNFPINREQLTKKQNELFYYYSDDELKPELLFKFALEHHKTKKEGQTLVFIDEAQRIFPIDRKYEGRKEWEQFFQLHRHYGFNVILVTQNVSYINKGVRIQAEYEVRHRKVSNYKTFGFFLGLMFGGGLFIYNEYWCGARDCTEKGFFRYKRKYGKLYDTFAGFKTDYGDDTLKNTNNEQKILEVEVIEDKKEVNTNYWDWDV